MSAPTQVDELATLRQTVAELTAKNTARKARITELEGLLSASQGETQAARAELTRIQVTEPFATLAAAISPTPELFQTELARIGLSIVHQHGKLVLMRDGKSVEGVEVTADGMRKHLLDSKDAAFKNMPHLLIASRATGSGATGFPPFSGGHLPETQAEPARRVQQFGLR